MQRFTQIVLEHVRGWIAPPLGMTELDALRHVRASTEATMERLVQERTPATRLARLLFNDIRFCFPLERQAAVWSAVASTCAVAERYVGARGGVDGEGRPTSCPESTRRGTPCRRPPLANGYCPSHQHLADPAARIGRAAVAS